MTDRIRPDSSARPTGCSCRGSSSSCWDPDCSSRSAIRFVQVTRFGEALRETVSRAADRRRRADAVPGLHDRARRLDRHRQHRRRRHRDRLRRARRALLDLVSTASSRWRSSSRKRCSACSIASLRPGRHRRVGADVLPARRPEVAVARLALRGWSPASPRSPPRRSRSRTRSPSSINSQFGVPDAGPSASCCAVLTWAGDHRRHQLDRPRRRKAVAAEGRPLPRSAGLIVIITHAARIPEVLSLVFREAFSMQAAIGTAQGRRRDGGAALRPRARHLRQRSGLRHGRRRLRHGREQAAACSRG